MEGLREEDFERKDTFLFVYGKEPELIKLILGSSFLPIESFEQAALEQEEDVTVILAARDIDPIEHYSANIRLENPKELKRAILDSVKYGELCNFTDSYSISQFYGLRADFDRIGTSFDDAVTLVKSNDAAIKLYHQKNVTKVVSTSKIICVLSLMEVHYLYISRLTERKRINEMKLNG